MIDWSGRRLRAVTTKQLDDQQTQQQVKVIKHCHENFGRLYLVTENKKELKLTSHNILIFSSV